MNGLIILLVFFILCIYGIYRVEVNEKKAAYLDICSDFNNRITESINSKLRISSAGLPINETEIAKLGLALIGKNVKFYDMRDTKIKDILTLYDEGEHLFLRMMAGNPSKSDKALKFNRYIQWFKEAWLLSECDFLLKDNEKSRTDVESKISSSIFEGLSSEERNFKIEYLEQFHISYEMFFTMLRAGNKNLNVNSLPPDDYRTHEGLKTISLDFNRPFGDRASSYENVFWAVLGIIDGKQHSVENNIQFSMENQLFYNLIRYLWIIFTESYLGRNKSVSYIPIIREYDPRSGEPDLMPDLPQQQPLEPPHSKPHQEPKPPQPPLPDIADTLIDIGLAHIGRTTALDNPYITPELTQARHNIERPFLKLLAERYTDADTRKNLSRHFMLYKEVTLFMIFASVLRNDKPLHTKVQRKLKIRLSLGLPSKVIVKCNDYRRKLSEKFYESYTRTKDLAGTLDYTFWSVLPERIKGENFADLVGNGCLMQIFDYTRKAVAREYAKISTGSERKH